MTCELVFEQLGMAVGAVGRQVATRLVARWLSGWSPGGCPVTRGPMFEQLGTAVGAVGRQVAVRLVARWLFGDPCTCV